MIRKQNIFVRLVAAFLTFCLMADPALAGLRHQNSEFRVQPARFGCLNSELCTLNSGVIASQALAPEQSQARGIPMLPETRAFASLRAQRDMLPMKMETTPPARKLRAGEQEFLREVLDQKFIVRFRDLIDGHFACLQVINHQIFSMPALRQQLWDLFQPPEEIGSRLAIFLVPHLVRLERSRDGIEARARLFRETLLKSQKQSAPAISQTEFFREVQEWELAPFLQELFALKWSRGDLTFSSRHAAASIGKEPYSVAMMVAEALKALHAELVTQGLDEPFPVWRRRWTIEIDAFENSLASLVQIQEGIYDHESLDELNRIDDASDYIEAHPDGFRMVSWLREWVHPIYIDLSDPDQLDVLARQAKRYDVTFSLYTLTYLPSPPYRNAVIEKLLSGRNPRYPHLLVFKEGGTLPLLVVRYEPDRRPVLSPAVQERFKPWSHLIPVEVPLRVPDADWQQTIGRTLPGVRYLFERSLELYRQGFTEAGLSADRVNALVPGGIPMTALKAFLPLVTLPKTPAGEILGFMEHVLNTAAISEDLLSAMLLTTLLRVPLIRAMKLLTENVRVFNPLSGFDLYAGIFGHFQWTVSAQMPRDQIEKSFSESARHFNNTIFSGLPFFPADILQRLGPLDHSDFDVLEQDLINLWLPFMRSGDLLYWKFAHEYLLSWDAFFHQHLETYEKMHEWELKEGRMKTWVDRFMDSLPDGMNVLISEHAWPFDWALLLGGAPGLAAYLVDRGGFEEMESVWLSQADRGTLDRLNATMRSVQKKLNVHLGNFEFSTGGSLHFLRRNRAAPARHVWGSA